MARIKKVVIPVAGLGTRGLPFTKEVPKELLPIIDTPAIHYIVEEVIAAGIEQVIFITSKGKSALEDYFDYSPALEAWLRKRGKEEMADRIHKVGSLCEVISVRQKEPLGLGHAVACARPILGGESFAVCLGDEIFPAWGASQGKEKAGSVLKTLVEGSEQLKSSVIGVVEVSKPETSSYGIIDIEGQKLANAPVKVKRTVEKPKPEVAPSQYAVVGRYVFENAILDCLREVKPGVGGEIQLTDAMDMLCKQGKLHAALVTAPRYDVGSHYSYVRAQLDCALQRPELAPKLKEYLRTL